MDPNQPILKFLFEHIEQSYSQALQHASDPVVIVSLAGEEDPDRGSPFEIVSATRSEVIEWLSASCPEAVELVATPDGSRPMTVVITAEGLSVYSCDVSEGFADPSHRIILGRCLEDCEMQWLRARERGMTDPIVELIEVDEVSPGILNVGAAVEERPSVAARLKNLSAQAARRIALTPAAHTPITIVIETVAGLTVVNRPLP